jgi:hydroxyacyl-ACP dehydratase HTD2-like protein with hotdog domain
MWAGGRIEWKKPLIIGGKASARMNIRSVDKKGFQGAVAPKVFVNQRIEIMNEGDEDCAIAEERTHVYLALETSQKTIREGPSI